MSPRRLVSWGGAGMVVTLVLAVLLIRYQLGGCHAGGRVVHDGRRERPRPIVSVVSHCPPDRTQSSDRTYNRSTRYVAIVRAVADAHDWSHSTTESEADGPRFEFRNVTVVSDE